MTADTPGQNVAQIRKEEAAITQVIDRLRRKFPELTEEDVHRAVHGHYDVFKGAPIRDFVPVLVENGARNELHARGLQPDGKTIPRETDQRPQHQRLPRSTSHEQPTQDTQSEGRL